MKQIINCRYCNKQHNKKTYCSKICMSLDYKERVSTNYKNNPNIIEKRKITNIEKYGVEHGCQNLEIKEKLKESLKDDSGLIGFQQIDRQVKAQETSKNFREEVNNKKKETFIKNYGTDSYFKTEKFIKDRTELWISKYGTTNIYDVTNPKTRSYKSIIYQSSYELYFIKQIEKLNLITYLTRGNIIEYNIDDKQYKYYIDFKFKDYQIEIKSNYTYNKSKQINDIKFNNATKLFKDKFVVLMSKDDINKFINKIKNEN